VFITAEIGINHQGNYDSARMLIEKARESGADAVKFQVYRTEKFYNRKLAPDAFDLFKSFELSFDEYKRLSEFSRSLDLVFYATPFDPESLEFLLETGAPVIKIASSDITNEPFLNLIAQKSSRYRFLTVMSTGFAGLDEIDRAVDVFRSNPALDQLPELPLSLLYCVSNYPVRPEDIDLNFIPNLRNRYHLNTGFSDHSEGINLSIAAAALGASLIERHFTSDRNIPGADHAMSLDPGMFKAMVAGIRDVEKAAGRGVKKITDFEKNIKHSSMRSMYASRDIKAGEAFTENNIVSLRPGDGIKLSDYQKLLNSKAARNIQPYEKI
jgi:sialic acid synthase SpsE